MNEKHTTMKQKEDRQLTIQYNEMKHEAESLKMELRQVCSLLDREREREGVRERERRE